LSAGALAKAERHECCGCVAEAGDMKVASARREYEMRSFRS
jgi:hypothetical protein